MVNQGWIKLSRALNGWRYKSNPNYVALWVHLLTNANTKDQMVGDVLVKRGCLLTSYDRLSKETGLSIQQVRSTLKKLNGEELTCKSTNRNTLISIVKFDFYQGRCPKSNTQNNKQITNKQQTNNNKQEYKEYKEYKNNIYIPVYDSSKNRKLSKDELDSLLMLRVKGEQ